MGFANRNIGIVAAALVGALSVDRWVEVVEPAGPRRAPAPAPGRTYKATGKRQAARHLRQMERIAAKKSAVNP